jgi:NADPH:quinone reductase-like Zn-dependent oxidoreductase
MRAVVHDRYGPPEVLHIEEVARPVLEDDQILVRVRATTVSRGDCHLRSATPFISRGINPLMGRGGFLRPTQRILGGEFAGEVEEVGDGVTEFAVGDRVFGTSLFGANAELLATRASSPVAHMPTNMTFEEAAAVSDGMILAVGPLRKAGVGTGTRILVYGASGSIGTASVQLAKDFGAHVTAVCNTKNLELVRALGANEAIDYLHEDFTRNGETYDVIHDAVGKHSFRRSRRSLNPGGIYIPTDGFSNVFWWAWTSRIGDQKLVFDLPPCYRKAEVLFLKDLIEAGKYQAVVDRTYPLEDVVEATRYVETGQKTGSVVLTVNGDRAA